MLGWMSAQTDVTWRVVEPGGAYSGQVSGALSGMIGDSCVATAMGWRAVNGLTVGDLVLTFDAGLQPVTRITRMPVWAGTGQAPRKFWPLTVPRGALGNREAIQVLPHQYLMIESDAGEELFGDPFSLIRASALEGVNGIEATPPAETQEAIVLHFEQDQVVFDQSGALFYCPFSGSLLDHGKMAYQALPQDEAEVLVMCIECDAALGSLCRTDAPEVFLATA